MNCIHTQRYCRHAMFCTTCADEVTARQREGEVRDAEARYASEIAATTDETLRTLLEHGRDKELKLLKRQAYVARVSANASRTDACGSYRDDESINKTGCAACCNVGTCKCRWVCFREHLDSMEQNGGMITREEADKVRAYIAKQSAIAAYKAMTPYQRMKADGTLAAQRAATAAKKVVDSEQDVSLQCAALGDMGGVE